MSREDGHSNEIAFTEGRNYIRRGRELADHRTITKRYRRDSRHSFDSDDSSDSIPNPMTFHNYAKRRRFSGTEDESENYIRYVLTYKWSLGSFLSKSEIVEFFFFENNSKFSCLFSSSSESNDISVSSTMSSNEDSDRENMRFHSINYLTPRKPLAPYSPVSSTTGAITLYRRLLKASPRPVNPFYQQNLMEIAMKTIILLQRNRTLHARLNQLKLETRAFVNSVMSNPENAKLRETLNQSNEKSMEHSSSKILAIKNQ